MTNNELNQIRIGKVLLAEPFMQDVNFKRSAVILTEHNDEGSVGFIMNKSIDMGVNELVVDFPEFEAPVFYGGPVGTDTIHFLHNSGELIDDSRRIAKGLFWGGDFEKLKFLIKSELILPQNVKFFVGYSGWSKGQLEEEIDIGSWVIADMDSNYLFKDSDSEIWEKIMNDKGNAYSVISSIPDYVNWN